MSRTILDAGRGYIAMDMKMRAAGDASVLVEFDRTIDPEVNRRVQLVAESLRRAGLAGVWEVTPAYASVLVRFEPGRTDAEAVKAIAERVGESDIEFTDTRTFTVPVCYGGDFGPDLAVVASTHGISEADVITRHSGRSYPIYSLGFAPGFPFLGGLDPGLHTPRLDQPRLSVPAGSVAIGGAQTGVYPTALPGGWRLIGRCPLRLFDPNRDPPVPYRAGDTIKFESITESEFRRLDQMPLQEMP